MKLKSIATLITIFVVVCLSYGIYEIVTFNVTPRLVSNITELIPIGTQIHKAEKQCLDNGFTVTNYLNSDVLIDKKVIKDADFLYCEREYDVPFLEKKWMIVLLNDGRVVTKISITNGLTGL